jgi:hypothetical protein
MTELPDPRSDRAYLRDVQYRTDANLAAPPAEPVPPRGMCQDSRHDHEGFARV